MNTDIEQLVRNRLHAELEQLVPDRMSPPARLTPSSSSTATAFEHRVRRGWRVPLAAAAVIAVVTVSLIRTGSPSAVSSPPDPAAVAGSRSYVAVGPAMTPLAEGRAVKLLTSWDQAAPGHPAPIDFRPVNASVSGTGAGQGIQSVRIAGAELTVEFTGNGTLPKNQDCGYDYTASALVSTRAVAVVTNADPGNWPDGPDAPCAYVATIRTLTITLPHPLGARPVLDVTTGSVIVPTP